MSFFSQFTLAQKTEWGLAVGGMSYSGDLYRGYNILKQNIGVQGQYRINHDKDVSFRFSLLYGQVSGDDSRPIDALGQVRNASFSRNLLEGSAVMEFHFLDYKNENSLIRWSPYVFGGIGAIKLFNTGTEDINEFQPVIPFGGGIKHLVGKQWSVGLEFGARKTFTDKLDGVSDGELFNKPNFDFGNPEDNDWYYFVGISITYIVYKVPCAYKYVPNKSLYR
ncbi:type IX secretion system protein PorG [Reichenbachiella ulvae]|uniref:DUF6089 family protein n=1 Tax=Reichenbachiella ulvae TaxID=2980104 RepID=A0ABT3CZ89_9BACT|nr:DUF6089 family protein [Reichenbachiella ulvae]MCV9388528.1 DUF6089 family protein [Reichenbachiella ulvae]